MNKKDLINRIKFIRDRARLSARELSLQIGKNEHYINRLEVKQDFSPTIDTLNDIIIACNSSFEEFFYSNIHDYQKDKELLSTIQKSTNEKKDLAIKILTI